MKHEKVKQITKGKVGYYWESEESAPVIEVFYTGTEQAAETIVTLLNSLMRENGIPGSIIQFETDSLGDNYQRILCGFSFDEVGDHVLHIAVNELSKHGESKYDEKDTFGFWVYPK